MFVIENPVGIQSFDVALEAVELRVCIVLAQTEIFVRRNFEITACFPVVKVYSEFGTIQIEYKLLPGSLVLSFPQEVFDVEGDSQKNPSPSEIDPQFGVDVRSKTQALSIVASQAVMFIPGTLFQHEGQIIFVGRNVGGIYRIQFNAGFFDFLSGQFDGTYNTVGQAAQ